MTATTVDGGDGSAIINQATMTVDGVTFRLAGAGIATRDCARGLRRKGRVLDNTATVAFNARQTATAARRRRRQRRRRRRCSQP